MTKIKISSWIVDITYKEQESLLKKKNSSPL